MTIEVNEDILRKYKLNAAQYLLLWAFMESTDIKTDFQNLVDRKIIQEEEDTFCIVPEEASVVENIHLKSLKKDTRGDDYYTDLAIALKNVYPKGRKPGTNTMWRGNTVEIIKKLKTLESVYHFEFTFDQAVEATKKYVESFNGNYDKMRVLKYFLLKTVSETDEDGKAKNTVVSDFMTFVENEDQDSDVNNWMDLVR